MTLPRSANSRKRFAATTALLAIALCASCAKPFHSANNFVPCSEPIADAESFPSSEPCAPPGSSDSPKACDCVHSTNIHTGIMRATGQSLKHVVTFPYRILDHTINFCAHNEAVGPPDIQAPGRFHPVPTHPVFEPFQESPVPTGQF